MRVRACVPGERNSIYLREGKKCAATRNASVFSFTLWNISLQGGPTFLQMPFLLLLPQTPLSSMFLNSHGADPAANASLPNSKSGSLLLRCTAGEGLWYLQAGSLHLLGREWSAFPQQRWCSKRPWFCSRLKRV